MIDPNPKPVQHLAYAARLGWLLTGGAVAAAELWGAFVRKEDQDTISETTRWVWRTDTRAGRFAFQLFWACFSAWFVPHVVKIERQETAS